MERFWRVGRWCWGKDKLDNILLVEVENMYIERWIKVKEEGNNERGIGELCSNEFGWESYGGILMVFIEEKF